MTIPRGKETLSPVESLEMDIQARRMRQSMNDEKFKGLLERRRNRDRWFRNSRAFNNTEQGKKEERTFIRIQN